MLPETYDDLDRHLPEADDIAAAAVPSGVYLAWCVNLQLLDPAFAQDHESSILRLRYREITGAEFFIAACGGRFSRAMLNPQGQRFTDSFYDRYLSEYRGIFGTDTYRVKDDWDHYDRLAPMLTRHFMTSVGHRAPETTTAVSTTLRKWWQRFR